MYMIKNAWNKVSEETIKNCWKKCDIINNVIDTEISRLMNIDYMDILTEMDYKLKILSLSRFSQNSCSAENFVNFLIIDSDETSEDLTTGEIFDIVTNKSIDLQDSIELRIDEETVLTFKQAKKAYNDLFKYFESKELFEDDIVFKSFNSIETKLNSIIVLKRFKTLQILTLMVYDFYYFYLLKLN